jgi:hypothetical protein
MEQSPSWEADGDLVVQEFPPVIETEFSLPFSQKPSFGRCTNPVEYTRRIYGVRNQTPKTMFLSDSGAC